MTPSLFSSRPKTGWVRLLSAARLQDRNCSRLWVVNIVVARNSREVNGGGRRNLVVVVVEGGVGVVDGEE